jgi:Tfp pilus assembly protein PilF
LTLTLIAGCAGPAAVASDPAPERGRKSSARQLYAGQPSVVHATEFPVTSAAEGVARGDDAWRQGKLDLAVYLYVQSLAYDPASAQPFLKIASIHEQLGNRALARKAFELALEREPENAGANERLGLLYLESRQDDAAGNLLHTAIRLDAQRWRAHNGLGILADRRKEYASAEQHYDRAHVLKPDDAAVINNRGYSRYLAGNLEAAEADLRYAIQLGAPAGTWTNLGKVLARQGRYEDALDAVQKESDIARAFNVLGEVAQEAGDLERARQLFGDAISAAPRWFQEAQDNLAAVNERLVTSKASGSPLASTPAGGDPARRVPADPLSVPVG